jgi:hypothetical protein
MTEAGSKIALKGYSEQYEWGAGDCLGSTIAVQPAAQSDSVPTPLS